MPYLMLHTVIYAMKTPAVGIWLYVAPHFISIYARYEQKETGNGKPRLPIYPLQKSFTSPLHGYFTEVHGTEDREPRFSWKNEYKT